VPAEAGGVRPTSQAAGSFILSAWQYERNKPDQEFPIIVNFLFTMNLKALAGVPAANWEARNKAPARPRTVVAGSVPGFLPAR
jgi:hypothetical protein